MKSDQIKIPRTREEFIEMIEESLAGDRAFIKKADRWIRNMAKTKSPGSRSSIAQLKSFRTQAEKNVRGQERLLKKLGVTHPDE